jgi:energy-converting hydrogenase Eha subunit G
MRSSSSPGQSICMIWWFCVTRITLSNPETNLLFYHPVHLTFNLLTPKSIVIILIYWVVHMCGMVTLGKKDNTLQLCYFITKYMYTWPLIFWPPKLTLITCVPWTIHIVWFGDYRWKWEHFRVPRPLCSQMDYLIPVYPLIPTSLLGNIDVINILSSTN